MSGDLLAFAGVMALGQFSPGPDMLLLTRTALAQGRTAGWWTTAGITTGLCVHAAIAIFGMAWLLSHGGWFAAGLRWAAAGYLAWLGIQLLQQAFLVWHSGSTMSGMGAGRSPRRSPFLRGLWCNLLNPKAALFFAAVVAEFVIGDRPVWWPAALWGIIVGQGMILWGAYVWLLQYPPVQRGYLRAAPWIDAAFGVGLLTLAVMVVVNR